MSNGLATGRRARTALRILMPIACLILLAVPSAAQEDESRNGRESVTRSGVTTPFRPANQRFAERVLDIVIDEREDLSRRFPRAQLGRIIVDVAGSGQEFTALSYGGVPDWGAGCAIEAERRIVVRSPRATSAPHDLRTLLRHELAHLAIQDELGEVRAPRWFHEGTASAVAGEWRLEESAAVAVAAWRGKLLRPSELVHRFPTNARRARLAYAESYQAVLLLEELAGVDTVDELVRAVGAGQSFGHAMQRMLSVDANTFDELLLRRLRERFGLALLLRRGNLLFVAAAVLLLVGALQRWRRSRHTLSDWEQQEREGRVGESGVGGSWR